MLSDLTAEGCHIWGQDLDLKEGYYVTIKPDGVEEILAVVRWTLENDAGIEFLRSLYGPVAEYLQQKH